MADRAQADAAISIHALLVESDTVPTLSALTRCDFYPRSPCGERLPTRETYLDIVAFLSTLSLRRATCHMVTIITGLADFYPRSPCGERQHAQQQHPQYIRHFYPRSPCGERPASGHRRPYQCQFLSTLSLRRATNYSIAQALRL